QHGSLSIGKGVSMFIDPGYFGNQHPEFAKQFQQVTGISIEDYYICHTYLTSNTNSKVDGKALFEFEQAVNSVAEEFRPIFASFLELESQDISDLRKAFWGDFEKESLSDFSDAPPFNDRELRTRPFFRTQDGRIIIIDPGLYFDKITDGPLFTMFGVGKAEYFIHKFGYAFEKAVHDYLRKLYPISPLNDRLSCPLMRQAIGTEPSSVELTDACLDYGEEMIIFEIKASFLRQDTVLENDNEKYVAMLREKYVLTSDGEPKGVTQLANTIIGLENDKYEAVDRDFSIVSKIFPVLLVHDELIDAPMHPHFFANEFIQALKPDEVLQNGFLKKGRFLVAPIALMTFEDLENLEFSIRRNGFSLKDALQRYIEMYPDRLQSFHNFCVEAQYQPYAGQIFAQVNLDFLAKTKDRLFPQNQDG
ncbi:MAG: hypothetical protein KAS32_17605, partial [Candidatus Peribacteraceae bacterium]|nr:hypothetical protein [Candidatus Peribacteraceae bacterium]